jgi:hypothetical protein
MAARKTPLPILNVVDKSPAPDHGEIAAAQGLLPKRER